MSDDHAFFSPSRLERILACSASIPLEEALGLPPQKPSVYAQHGTHLHGVTDHVTTKGIEVLPRFELDIADKTLVLDCVDYLETLIKSLGHTNYRVQSESRVTLRPWGLEMVWGTLDKSISDNVKRHMHIIDWKFGSGVPVFLEDNPQLLAYAAGAVGWPTLYSEVTMHVVQPALDSYQSKTINIHDLFDWVHTVLAPGINKAMKGGGVFNPGEVQCRWCPNVGNCDAYDAWINAQASRLFELHALLPENVTPETIKEFLDKAPAVEQAIKAYKAFVTREIEHGHAMPGFKLVEGRSNRQWKDEKAAVTWLAANTKIEEFFVSKAISPAQAEKLDRGIAKNEEYLSLWDKPPGKPTLTSENDARPAIKLEKSAQEVFQYFKVPDKLE